MISLQVVLQIRVFRMAGDFFVRVKDDRDQGVGGPSLKTPNEGPGSKSRKEINLEDFKIWIWTN